MRVDAVNLNCIKNNKITRPILNNGFSKTTGKMQNDVFVRNNAINFTSDLFDDHMDVSDYNWAAAISEDTSDYEKKFRIKWEQTFWKGGHEEVYPIDELDILGMDNEELSKLADAFCLHSDYDVVMICRRFKMFLKMRWSVDKEATGKAYVRLSREITKKRREVEGLLYTLQNFDKIKLSMIADTSRQKEVLATKLLEPIKMRDEKGINVKIPNGIFIHGTSESGKKEIYSWIQEKSGLRVKTLDYNTLSAQKSMDDLLYCLQEAETIYQSTKIRTVLDLKNFDTLLANCKTSKDRRMVAQFKNIAESVSEKYHTTLLIKTDTPIEEFEASSIGEQRFDIKLFMDQQELTDRQNKLYEETQQQLYYYLHEAENAQRKYTIAEYTPPPEKNDNFDDYLNYC